MAAKTDVRPKITMACQECKHRNYITKKNRRNDPDRVELKKYCPTCKTHTVHKETVAQRSAVVGANVRPVRAAPVSGCGPDVR